jgi:hypothetical protein
MMTRPTLAPLLIIQDEAALLFAADGPTGPFSPTVSQQLSRETTGETPAGAVWRATVRNGAAVVLTHDGPLLQVLALAAVINRFWPALRVCVRRQQHRSPRTRGLRRR